MSVRDISVKNKGKLTIVLNYQLCFPRIMHRFRPHAPRCMHKDIYETQRPTIINTMVNTDYVTYQ